MGGLKPHEMEWDRLMSYKTYMTVCPFGRDLTAHQGRAVGRGHGLPSLIPSWLKVSPDPADPADHDSSVALHLSNVVSSSQKECLPSG